MLLTPNISPMTSATLSPNPSYSTDSFQPIERVANRLVGAAFSPHRHDTYTVALTMAGVQAFNYRGSMRHSLPGQVLILHPDEMHDGHCSDEAGFSYRAAYVPPTHLQAVLGGAELPFVSNGVSTNPALIAAAFSMVIDCAGVEDPGAYEDALYDLAHAMNNASGRAATVRIANRTAVMRAREFLETAVVFGARLDELEQVADCDRWQLSRDFRALLGTSPVTGDDCIAAKDRSSLPHPLSAYSNGGHVRGDRAPYAASKAGLIGLVKSLASDHAASGIRVNATLLRRSVRIDADAATKRLHEPRARSYGRQTWSGEADGDRFADIAQAGSSFHC